MLLQEPGHSPYDLRFHLLGFPVRVSWSFWLAGVIFGFSLVRGMDGALGLSSPGMLPLLMLWTVCLLVSILIHELGHALAFRQNGMNASIVLYHFGGLAIPTSSYSPDRFFRHISPILTRPPGAERSGREEPSARSTEHVPRQRRETRT